MQFSKIVFTFTGGESVTITKEPREDENPIGQITKQDSVESLFDSDDDDDDDDQSESDALDSNHLRFVLEKDNKTQSWLSAGYIKHDISRIYSRLSRFITREGPRTFSDDQSGETLTLEEVIRRYGRHLPLSIRRNLSQGEPEEFSSLIGAVDCHLIETQRLMVVAEVDARRIQRRRRRSPLVVQHKAEKLQSIVKEALTKFATLSQAKDSTFPRRAIEARQDQYALSEHDLRVTLSDLESQANARQFDALEVRPHALYPA